MSIFYSGVLSLNELERLYGLIGEGGELILGFHFFETEQSKEKRLEYQGILNEDSDDHFLLSENGHDYFTIRFSYGLKYIENKKEYNMWLSQTEWHSEDKEGNLDGGCSWFLKFDKQIEEDKIHEIINRLEMESELIQDLQEEFYIDLENLKFAQARLIL
jgi:hypothetical protein